MRTRVYRSTDPSPPTAEQETAVCLRIPRRHAPVKALQRPLDDPLDCPVRPTHTSIDRNGHRECHFPHSCTSSGGRVGAGFWTALSKDDHPPSRHDARASARPTRRMLSVGGTASSGVARNGGGSTYGRSAEDEHQPHATLRSDVGQRSPPSTTDIPAWLVALRLHVEHLERLPIERRRARLRHDHPLAVRLAIPSGHAPPSSLCVAVCSAAAAAGECRGQSHIIACRDVHVVHLDNHRTWTTHGTTRVPMRAVRIEALQWQLGHGIEREDIGGHRVTRCPRCPWRAPRAASCPPGRGSRLRLWLGPCSYAFFSRKRVDAGFAVLHTEEPALTVPQLPSTTRRSDRRPYQSAEQRRSWSTASAPAHPRPAQRTAARPWLRPAP
jgi:hypothetical protein